MTVAELNKKLQAVNIEALKLLAVNRNREVIVQLNRDQMRAGLRSDGSPITPQYSTAYGFFKQRQSSFKAPPFTPDLFDSGSFQGAMFMKLTPRDFFITSRDSKLSDLTARYQGIFGLTTDNTAEARNSTTREFVNLWRKQVGL